MRHNPQVKCRIGAATALGPPGLPDAIGPMVAATVSEENRWIDAQRTRGLIVHQ